MLSRLVFIDVEVSVRDKKLHDIGALSSDGGKQYHSASERGLYDFIRGYGFVCGHNIVHHDLHYLRIPETIIPIDTLYISPLLFPRRPYHKLLKDDKLQVDELNNPLNDCKKTWALFNDELNAYNSLNKNIQKIYCTLLHKQPEFEGFFEYVGEVPFDGNLAKLIQKAYKGHICEHADVDIMVQHYPVELAYALAIIGTKDPFSITPPWVIRNYPKTDNVVRFLCGTHCKEGCEYCNDKLNIHRGLKRVFGFDQFRLFDGLPMQEEAVEAAMEGKSLLIIFPTGGGKSLTFQLPAILMGKAVHGLTVVISPLQSLMKDQVDNLASKGFTEAVTINGLLDPVSRADAFQRLADGSASLLYISPEMLRSKTIERLLMGRNVVRFVIDEAHCFSAWGHDFRVDYLYIGTFLRNLQEQKQQRKSIPVSCFTATAKQKVVSDIKEYFLKEVGVNLQLFASTATRTNLTYSVIHADTDEEKYVKMRNILMADYSPAIVYVSRTRRTFELANKLKADGFNALPFNGKMSPMEKIANQNAFIQNDARVIVATSAFGMGVDKPDIGVVIHYDISDSLENYIQEAGRAGRDLETSAKCYVLYADHDLDKHFILLNQTKLSISEIQQVWKAIKNMTKEHKKVNCSALEIARQAGWDDGVEDVETRVRTAISALENAEYVSRGHNMPRVFATSILVNNVDEARQRIMQSQLMDEQGRANALRIIKSLISSKYIARAQGDEAESRVDYLADMLGLRRQEIITAVGQMRQGGILADTQDMTAYISKSDSENHSMRIFEQFARLEQFLIERIDHDNGNEFYYKELNEAAEKAGVMGSTVKRISTLLFFLTIKGYIHKRDNIITQSVKISFSVEPAVLKQRSEHRVGICRFLVERLFYLAAGNNANQAKEVLVNFSLNELLEAYNNASLLKAELPDISEALLFLAKIGSLRLEGGFMVLYNAMEINRLKDAHLSFKKQDYRLLDEFYQQKIRQIHIVGEFANIMVRDYDAALQYVQDYFQMDFRKFIARYFKGERVTQISKNITPERYCQLFDSLSKRQLEVINDHESSCIVVAAGPGSGKTKVLVHKLASLLLLEDVKHEQLLMLTFSRTTATEFKKRLMGMIGNAVYFVEIKTFHAFSFDLLGKIGNLNDVGNVVKKATEMIEKGEIEPSRIAKSVLVIDEAQDMDADEYALVTALIHNNPEMRVIAVGDDDQNIFQFRGSDSRYMQLLLERSNSHLYELTDNFRSTVEIVDFANRFAKRIPDRIKHSECKAVTKTNGEAKVFITEHPLTAVVDYLRQHYKGGNTGVLTSTNNEAMQIAGMLTQAGLKAQLIQSIDGFRFGALAEIRHFTYQLYMHDKSPMIPEELWQQAMEKTRERYGKSSIFGYIERFFSEFEATNRMKFRGDLKDFIFESHLEDFCPPKERTITVSTIHKAKGREFDTICMALSGASDKDAEGLKKLYVGITRARKQLLIFEDNYIFHNEGATPTALHTISKENEIKLALTFRDVNLGFFKDKQTVIRDLMSGMQLQFHNHYLQTLDGKYIAVLSEKKQQEMKVLTKKGFSVSNAIVSYVLHWHPANEDNEYMIILADLTLTR